MDRVNSTSGRPLLNRNQIANKSTALAAEVAAEITLFSWRMLLCGALALAALMATSRARADELRIGQPIYGGTGCPNGSAAIELGSDGSSLNILFDQFVAEAGGETGKHLDRKACSLAIPLQIPAGLSVALIRIDYNGFAAVPFGALAQFTSETFFAGEIGERITRDLSEVSGEFTISDEAAAVSWSECGANATLRVNSSVVVSSDDDMNPALLGIGSADASAGLIYRLAIRSCGDLGGGAPANTTIDSTSATVGELHVGI